MRTLKEMKEHHARQQSQTPDPPISSKEVRARTRNIYGDPAYAFGGSKEGETEVKEVVLVDEETGITCVADLLFRRTHPCNNQANGRTCLQRETQVSETCDNCWDLYRRQNGMDDFY